MNDLEHILSRAQNNLNNALVEYEAKSATLALEFRELKLQACMFQYEICAEMAGLARNRPSGFATAVALKGLIHRLYEYDKLLHTQIIRRLLALAKARGVPVDGKMLKAQRRQWKHELLRLQQWSDIRNETTGHYGKSIARQVELLKGVSSAEVLAVAQAFLRYNMDILLVMKNAGAGEGA